MSKKGIVSKSSIIYFSHGGGPLPLLNDSSHMKMIEFMKKLPKQINRPNGIIVFSAHWEEEIVTIQSREKPEIIYDYYGFPKEAYSIEYNCSGNYQLALRVLELFKKNNISTCLDDKRPYDHGSYIPLKLMYPEADIPVIQISLKRNLDPLDHLKVGKALRPLLDSNLLIIGSGFSFHNMREFDFSGSEIEDPLNNQFQDSLIELSCNENFDNRWEKFKNWEELPGARYCHPREEHLLPLIVCSAISTTKARKVFDDYIIGKRAIGFIWD